MPKQQQTMPIRPLFCRRSTSTATAPAIQRRFFTPPRAIRPLSSSLFTSTRTMATNMNTSSETAKVQADSQDAPSFSSVGIRNTSINEAPGVQLSAHQKLLVGSVLDLFEGNPTLKNFSLWSPTAVFEDPLAKAAGEAKYKAQWYGLPALFHPIKLQSHRVVSAGNPIELEANNKYTVRGINKDHTINSIVQIFAGEDGKIAKVVDKWNGKLPEGAIVDTFRKLNAATVPWIVTVPKTEEEDLNMQAARDKENENTHH